MSDETLQKLERAFQKLDADEKKTVIESFNDYAAGMIERSVDIQRATFHLTEKASRDAKADLQKCQQDLSDCVQDLGNDKKRKSELNILKQELKVARKKSMEQQELIDKMTLDRQSIEETLANARQRISHESNARVQADRSLEERNTRVDQLKQEIIELNRQIDLLKQENKREVLRRADEKSDWEEEKAKLQQNSETAEQQYKATLRDMQSQVDQLKQQVAQGQQPLRDLTDKVQRLEKDRIDLEQRHQIDIQALVASHQAEVRQLRTDMAQAEAKARQLDEQRQRLEAAAKKPEARIVRPSDLAGRRSGLIEQIAAQTRALESQLLSL